MAHDLDSVAAGVRKRYERQPEFVQAATRALHDLAPLCRRRPDYLPLVPRLLEPDRLIRFRVDWEADDGEPRAHTGYRVQWSDVLGPYKGGLRFHPGVNASVLKFLAFEQTFKNALTQLALGGAKGGADFDPREHSDREVRRFCRAFMLELSRYIGSEQDVPAGDIGVGEREIGWLLGAYRQLGADGEAAFTGKPLALHGSNLRREATGYGVVYFARSVLARRDDALEGTRCVVSGAGNVALHTAEKLVEMGARVLTLSDRHGVLHAEGGIDAKALERIQAMRRESHAPTREIAGELGFDYEEGRPWGVACDAAFPCATQNELDREAAETLASAGCRLVCEGANMPCTDAAVDALKQAEVTFAPGKAANAGGVAVSEFEMAQAASRERWSREQVDQRLRRVMESIHDQCVEYGSSGNGGVDYEAGATRAGFARVAEALLHM